jgi:hypothetical protein
MSGKIELSYGQIIVKIFKEGGPYSFPGYDERDIIIRTTEREATADAHTEALKPQDRQVPDLDVSYGRYQPSHVQELRQIIVQLIMQNKRMQLSREAQDKITDGLGSLLSMEKIKECLQRPPILKPGAASLPEHWARVHLPVAYVECQAIDVDQVVDVEGQVHYVGPEDYVDADGGLGIRDVCETEL